MTLTPDQISNLTANLFNRKIETLYILAQDDKTFFGALEFIMNKADWDSITKKIALRTLCSVVRVGTMATAYGYRPQFVYPTPRMKVFEKLISLSQKWDEKRVPFQLWEDLFSKHLDIARQLPKISSFENFDTEIKALQEEVFQRHREFLDKGIAEQDY
jgi:hypothetical protein